MADNNTERDIFDFDELMADPKTNPVKETSFEKQLALIDADDAAADNMSLVKFQFRDMFSEERLEKINANKEQAANKMMRDHSIVLRFGSDILDTMNQTARDLLKNQRNTQLREPDALVSDMMRMLDGHEQKYQGLLEKKDATGLVSKIKGWFANNSYDLATFVRDSKPIDEKLDIIAGELKGIEQSLELNVERTKTLHEQTIESLERVTDVLGGMEILIESAKEQAAELDTIIQEAQAQQPNDGLVVVEFKGEKVPLDSLKNTYAIYAAGIDEMEKTWFDWRQQFFLGYAQAPSLLNIGLVSNTLRRRCHVFRTMGIPAARRSLTMWLSAAAAAEGAEKGKIIQEGLDSIVAGSFKATGQAVTAAAMASQTPTFSRETIDTAYEAMREMSQGIVAASRWGQEQRELTLQSMEQSERGIQSEFLESRRELISLSINKARAGVDSAPAIDQKFLSGELEI